MIKLIVFTTFMAVHSFAALTPELVFPSAVEISPRNQITAYDVVEAKNLNSKTENELKSILLGNEKTVKITKNELIKMFRTIKAKFYLPSEFKFLRSKSQVSRMELERKIKNRLLSSCADCDLQIRISSVPSNMPSDWDLDMNIDMNKNSVNIPVFSSANQSKKGWIVAELKRYQLVPVLNRAARIGEVINPDMISMETRQIVNPNETIISPRSLIGVQAARFLNPGQVISFNDLKREQILKKGQFVKAIVGSDSFEVSISALAEEAGSLGDVVKVKNMDSQKIFAGKIVERGIVRIE